MRRGARFAASTFRSPICGALATALSACTIVRETQPARTATEQLAISAAAEQAADQMPPDFAHGAKVFVHLAASAYDATSGALRQSLDPEYGYSIASTRCCRS